MRFHYVMHNSRDVTSLQNNDATLMQQRYNVSSCSGDTREQRAMEKSSLCLGPNCCHIYTARPFQVIYFQQSYSRRVM